MLFNFYLNENNFSIQQKSFYIYYITLNRWFLLQIFKYKFQIVISFLTFFKFNIYRYIDFFYWQNHIVYRLWQIIIIILSIKIMHWKC